MSCEHTSHTYRDPLFFQTCQACPHESTGSVSALDGIHDCGHTGSKAPRRSVALLLSLAPILTKHTALKSMGKEFLSGYIALAEGEKDPRNLLLAFAIDRVLLLEFDISAHIEVRRASVLLHVRC